jgi:segregation and condensation protein B
VPGKPELLGTTREFLDYFSLKRLDDLPTLAQLKELEELRVQLTLPGAEPEVGEAVAEGDPVLDAQAEEEEEESREEDGSPPQSHGLVARGAHDDAP